MVIDDRGLRKLIKQGSSVTLVLGAGVSCGRGLPLWPELLRSAWEAVMGRDPYAVDMDFLERSRRACLQEGLPPEFVQRLDFRRHPLELQFAFECIFDRLRWSGARKDLLRKLKLAQRTSGTELSNEQLAADSFAALLRKILYRGQPSHIQVNSKATDTLSLIAHGVRRSAVAAKNDRRVARVITFNVDDLLEQLVNAGNRRRRPLALPVTRVNDINRLSSRRSIEIVHLHGFVPQRPSEYPFYTAEGGMIEDVRIPVESLVFTDEQYWQTVGSPNGFASRMFAQALDGICVFIGLSMTDINIIRWLAQYSIEAYREFRLMASSWKDQDEAEFDAAEELSRHFWIVEREPNYNRLSQMSTNLGSRVLKQVLRRRGVERVEIPSWQSEEFHSWWRSCFLS